MLCVDAWVHVALFAGRELWPALRAVCGAAREAEASLVLRQLPECRQRADLVSGTAAIRCGAVSPVAFTEVVVGRCIAPAWAVVWAARNGFSDALNRLALPPYADFAGQRALRDSGAAGSAVLCAVEGGQVAALNRLTQEPFRR